MAFDDSNGARVRAGVKESQSYAIAELLQTAGACMYVESVGPWLLGRPDDDLLQLQGSSNTPVRGVESILDGMVRPRDVLAISLTLQETGSEGRILDYCKLPVSIGSECTLVLGTERTHIRGYDTQIATSAVMGEPITHVSFDGLLARIRTDVAPSGALVVTADIAGHVLRENRRFDFGGRFLEWANQLTFESVRVNDRIVIDNASGAWKETLGDRSGGDGLTLILEVE